MMSFLYRLGVTVAWGGLLGALASGCAQAPAADGAGAEAGEGLAAERGDDALAAERGDGALAADVDVDVDAVLAAPTVLASGQELPLDVAVDGTSVYWVNATDFALGPSAIRSTPKAGGGAVTDVAAGIPDLGDFELDATRVFWGQGAAAPDAGGVRSTPKSGGAVTDLLEGARVFQIALEGDDVYVASPDAGGRLLKLPKAGGAATTLAVVGPGLDNVPALAPGGDKLFFSQSTFDVACDGRVSFVPKAGGAAVTVADGICGLLDVEADAFSVYWSQWDDAAQTGKIVRKTAPFATGVGARGALKRVGRRLGRGLARAPRAAP
ncbi:MAG TPA: hypothetical protein VFS00_34055, partial [Polyangiaceae bacterium]|nr:hypothetical protein [Polyangiaceae bacterium]